MTKIRPVAVFDCIVFGATGDLTLRKLLPALYYRFHDGQMPANSRIIGAARSQLSDDDYRQRAAKTLAQHLPKADQDAESISQFLAQLHYVSIDATSPDADWSRFGPVLDDTPRPGLLPRHLARPLRSDLPRARRQRHDHRTVPRRAGKADRSRCAISPRNHR